MCERPEFLASALQYGVYRRSVKIKSTTVSALRSLSTKDAADTVDTPQILALVISAAALAEIATRMVE